MNLVKSFLILLVLNFSFTSASDSNIWKKTNGPFGTDVKQITYDINSGDIYLATINDGVYKSSDDGQFWEKITKGELTNDETVNSVFISKNNKIFAITDSSGIFLLDENGYWVAKNSGFGGHLSFSCMLQLEDNSLLLASKGKAVFKSTNNGDSWSNFNTGLNYDEIVNVIISAENNLYLGSNKGFFISKDKGKKWTLLESEIGIVNTLFNFNDSLIFIGTNKGLFVSNLSGSNIKQINDAKTKLNIVSIIYKDDLLYCLDDSKGIYTFHLNNGSNSFELSLAKAGLNDIKIINNNFFVAFKQGVFIWDNQNLEYINNGLANLTVNDFVSFDNKVYCATNNGIYLTTNEGYKWEPSNDGFNQNLHITCLLLSKSNIFLAGTTGDGLYFSEDFGKNWRKNDNPDLTSIYINDIAMDSVGIIYVGTIGKGVFKSSDGGLTWSQMFGNGIENLEISKLAINLNNEVFAGTPDNGMFIKTSTSNWRYLENLPVGITQIYDIEIINQENKNAVIISTNLGIFNSFSNGVNWIKTNSNLQAPAINLYYNIYDSTLYAGLKYVNGLFTSKDLGNSWEFFVDKSGLSAKKITSLVMSDLGFLYAGTERGLVYRTLHSFKGLEPKPAKVTVVGNTEFCEGGFTILEADQKFFDIQWSNGKRALFDTVWQSGQYWYTATDTLGLQVISDTITIEVYPKPKKPYILFNGELLLCSEDAFGYRWYFDSKPIDNSNFKTLNPEKDGWYKCEIFSEFNCRNISDEIYVELTSVNEIKSDDFMIYPNPANDLIMLDGNFGDLFNIEIYNLTGVKLIEVKSKKIINIHNLKSGIYFIKISYNDVIKMSSFVKK